MTEKTIKFRDPVVETVVDKFVGRSDVGFSKYGQTLDKERKTGVKDLAGYLNDVQEELMDALLYIESAKRCLSDEVEDLMLKHYAYEDEKRMNIIGQNGNDGLHYDSLSDLDVNYELVTGKK